MLIQALAVVAAMFFREVEVQTMPPSIHHIVRDPLLLRKIITQVVVILTFGLHDVRLISITDLIIITITEII